MTALEILFLAVAGVLAGAANTVAGGGTFISYPALLAVGLPPISANVTSAVGLVSGYAGGTLSFRRELAGQGRRMRRLLPTVLLGAATGAVALLATPASTFTAIVPFLVLAACALLFFQPRIKALVKQWRGATPVDGDRVGVATHVGVFVAAIYGTYFGAGLGVMLLAVLGALIVDHLQRINGLRTALALNIKIFGVLIFLFSGQVVWIAAAVLFVTAFVGGSLGAAVSRRLSEPVLRWTVILCGVVVAVMLFVTG